MLVVMVMAVVNGTDDGGGGGGDASITRGTKIITQWEVQCKQRARRVCGGMQTP